ncbi:MAG: aminotransferase [Bacilli bacterium]|nr:aminotransferase [Bacilli bacterium]
MSDLLKQFENYKVQKLDINMARGKPCPEQLNLSLPMLDIVNSKSNCFDEDIDCRNYSALEGIPDCKKLFADILDIPSENILVEGASSMNIMHNLLSKSIISGICGEKPFSKQGKIKWLCPVPGYDRHFAMTEYFGFEMINIPMDDNGPDMDLIEEYVKDPQVKGIWCVPKYSNPTGIIYSDEVVRRFARLKPAAKDFRIYWDNTYISQLSFNGEEEPILNIFDECKKYGSEDLVYEFASTSKMTFPGSGVSAVALSDNNKKDYLNYLQYQLICFDKLNQLRHALFLKDKKTIIEHMKKHAKILKPKFDLVLKIFDEELKDIAIWSKPTGGYFISLYVKDKAKEVVEKCKEMGVTLTKAGSAYPYRKDPDNSHIRIAPTYLADDELETATRVICLAVKLVK